jgi:folate-binding protein YgfZ
MSLRMQRPSDEYRTIAARAGWFSKAGRGRLMIEGRDAASFLHALLSNDVQGLHAGEGRYTTYLTPQGRMLADIVVYQCGDRVLLDVPHAESLAARFDQAIFSEDVRIGDVSGPVDQLGVIGPAAAEVVARVTSAGVDSLRALPVRSHLVAGDVRIARTDDAPLPSLDVFFPAAARSALIARLAEAGAVELSADLVEALRIDAGRPAFGVDITGETIPLEAGLLERAISLTKGCYVGQEVIIRVLHRGAGRVAKRLVRLAFDAGVETPPAPGTPLSTEAGDTGRITSAAFSPRAGRVVALGYVHRDAAEVGRRLSAAGAPAEIVAMAG